MRGMSSLLRVAAAAVLAVGVAGFGGSMQSQAAPIPLAFDFTTGSPSTVATINGSGGHMEFVLDLGDPTLSNVFGNFSMDIEGPGSTPLGSVSLIGGTFLDGASQGLGDAAANPVSGLPNISTWFLDVGPLDLPLSLVVTSQLDTLGDPLAPLLTVEFSNGNLQVTPLPGALALFATGIGVFGLIGSRRKRKINA
jgi:hypothetical protein